jgi:zinc D-Ala-D-Ala dipeptidase
MSKWQRTIGILVICWLLIIGTNNISLAIDPIPSQWTEISKTSQIDISFPYATKDNFVKIKLYPCASCFLRTDVANAVQQASQKLQQQGYVGLRLFDCYRPQPIQQTMWNIKPDERYVANPAKGSDHNRGTAVDLTI